MKGLNHPLWGVPKTSVLGTPCAVFSTSWPAKNWCSSPNLSELPGPPVPGISGLPASCFAQHWEGGAVPFVETFHGLLRAPAARPRDRSYSSQNALLAAFSARAKVVGINAIRLHVKASLVRNIDVDLADGLLRPKCVRIGHNRGHPVRKSRKRGGVSPDRVPDRRRRLRVLMERHLQILPPPFDVGAREAPLLFPLARLDLLGFCLLGPHPPHHSRIGALHGDPRRQQRHVVLRPARSSSPLPRASALGPDHYARLDAGFPSSRRSPPGARRRRRRSRRGSTSTTRL